MNLNRTRLDRRGVFNSAAAMLIVAFAAGCGGGGDSTGTGDLPPGFIPGNATIAVSPTSLTLVQGKSVTATVTLTRNGAGSQKTIDLATSVLTTGVTATFNPASLAPGVSSSIVTFAAAANANIVTITPSVLALIGGDTLAIDGPGPAITLQIKNARPGILVTKAGSGSGTVTSTPAGVNCGPTCNAQFDALTPITLTAVPATGSAFTNWSGSCVGSALTCTFTPNDFGNTVIATFTSTAQAISLTASPSPVSVQAGGTATSTINLARLNGFADAANLTISAPSGITVSANPSSITGTASTLTINAAGGLAAGNYPVTITATGTGVTQQSITLPIQIPVAASGGSVAFNYATCDASQVPMWFAVQNGTGPWTRVTPSNNTFTFTLGPTGAYAVVTRNGADTVTSVMYATATEIASIAAATPCGPDPATGTKRMNGTMLNASTANQTVFPTIIVGGAQFTKTSDSTNAFTLIGVPSGSRDLIAASIHNAANVSRMLIRRNTNYANNQNIPTLDLTGTESFNPPLSVLTPVSFGPRVAGIAVSTISTSPYLRLRGQAASQGAYTAGAIAYFAQGNRTVSVGMTAGYVGTAPATWMLDIPDLTTGGYDPSWALKSGQSTAWEVDAAGGDVLPFIGGNPTNNAQIMIAGAQQSSAPFSTSRFRTLRRPRRGQ
jgi:hypothetical protein